MISYSMIKESGLWMDPPRNNKRKRSYSVFVVEELIFVGTALYVNKRSRGVEWITVMFAGSRDIVQETVDML